MVFVFVVCFINILLTSLTAGYTNVEIKSNVGSPVNFYLPVVELCGQYNFTDSKKNIIVSVLPTSKTIDPLYEKRGTCKELWNKTVVFTLSRIVDSDFMVYLVTPDSKAGIDCWVRYTLTKENDETFPKTTTITSTNSGTAYWLSWESWSSCQATCGYGERSRTRSCSIHSLCGGVNVETSTCSTNKPCHTFDWSPWSGWSGCSVTCGGGERTRYRKCMRNTVPQSDNSNCVGDVVDRGQCAMQSCHTGGERTPLQVTPLYEWSGWSKWSTCSQSCATGMQSRVRSCLYFRRVIDVRYCTGDSQQNETCSAQCVNDKSAHDEVVQLPLSVIIGGGSVLFILILFVVIVVLVVKLRKKKTRTVPVFIEPPNRKQSGNTNRSYGRPKHSIVSFTSMGASSDHYDTINDEDVSARDRQSVITMDNTYVSMPKSPGDTNPYNNDAVMYNNTHETVFMFDKPTGSGRKVSNAYQNSGSSSQGTGTHLDVPRHMSVDSVGYLMPGSAADRAIKRTKKYKPKL